MRIILIRINIMSCDLCSDGELTISSKDVDYSKSTVELLTKNLISQIDIVAKALCECPGQFKSMLEAGQVKVGGYQAANGSRLIYLHFRQYDYLIPYMITH
jgi:hypothetical protein